MISLTDTKVSVLICTRCSLHLSCKAPVYTTQQDNRKPLYSVVGEAPGKVEDEQGQPFVGPTGMYLKRTLRKYGARPSDGAWMNAVSCFPAALKNPAFEHVTACRRNLFAQLDQSPAVPCLVVGSVALQALMPSATMMYAMGGPIPDMHGKTLFPIYHPSYVLRAQSRQLTDMWYRHVKAFADMVKGLYVTRDTLQIANCVYCNAQRMTDNIVCIRHERLLAKDKIRKVGKLVPPKQPSLFE